ncbi:DUF1707 domain-containing protein [Cutibacterium equinum]|uniref:DUF1707 domain-containing protein n=1 Tax=Cutibacterium equinum TaxID=3016342 RepID=A0ABY7QWM5_9ACTN|nr:DUF1707 domain-containing protein [Cutibacterium equinum]WCC79125.1 DUF1707 domain-containing protein [Cutibacterium equinum]
MSTAWHPDDSSLRVTNEQRERVVDHINDAYAHAVIDDAERERRIETALLARTRSELDQSYRGMPSFKPSVPEAIRAPLPQVPAERPTTGVGLCALSGLVSGPFGPAIGVAVTRQGTWARKMVRRQFISQVVFFVLLGFFGVFATPGFSGNTKALGLVGMMWVTVTIIQAIRGFQGRDH